MHPSNLVSSWLGDGLKLLAAGDHAAVRARLAARQRPGERAEWEHLAGSLAQARGDFPAAVRHFEAALQTHPDCALSHYALGVALRSKGQTESALGCFRQAVELAPDYVDALIGQGEVQLELGDYEDARDCFEVALAHAPDEIRALIGIARLLRTGNAAVEAIAYLQKGLVLGPDSAELHFELGLCLNRAGDTQGALSAYRRADEFAPNHYAAMVNAGLICLTQLGDAATARVWFERAIKTDPGSAAAQANLGIALQDEGRFSDALAHYDRLLAEHPETIEYRWNRAIAYLAQGDFERAWPDYELRHTRGGRDVRRRFPLPEWSGNGLDGRQILVYGEQGLGDEIMFASCLPQLLRLAQGVVVECDERLASLFQRSFPAAAVHGAPRDADQSWLNAHPQLDVQVAIGSLPRYLRSKAADFPRDRGYLIADADRVADWTSRWCGRERSLNIGLSWHGGTLKTREEMRSLTIDLCMPLLSTQDCRFVCLQRGDCTAEVAAAQRQNGEFHWWPQVLQNTDELAALIASLDLVISVDNTVAHLAGALGKDCWILLSHGCDWRYLARGDSMPWYPSARLFRQTHPGDWLPVIESVAAGLSRLKHPSGVR